MRGREGGNAKTVEALARREEAGGGGNGSGGRSSMGGHGERAPWSSAEARVGEREVSASAGEAPSEPGAAPLRRQHARTRGRAVGRSIRAWPPRPGRCYPFGHFHEHVAGDDGAKVVRRFGLVTGRI